MSKMGDMMITLDELDERLMNANATTTHETLVVVAAWLRTCPEYNAGVLGWALESKLGVQA